MKKLKGTSTHPLPPPHPPPPAPSATPPGKTPAAPRHSKPELGSHRDDGCILRDDGCGHKGGLAWKRRESGEGDLVTKVRGEKEYLSYK